MNPVLQHYKDNPFKLHLLAWMTIAIPFALLMMPTMTLVNVVAFGTSAMIFCVVLCVATYPLSGHYSFTIVGGLVALTFFLLGGELGVFKVTYQMSQLFLLTGAMIGSSSVVWKLPLNLLNFVLKRRAGD